MNHSPIRRSLTLAQFLASISTGYADYDAGSAAYKRQAVMQVVAHG